MKVENTKFLWHAAEIEIFDVADAKPFGVDIDP